MKYIDKIELADRWQCHPTNIDYHVKRGRIKAVKVKNKMRYLLSSVEAFEIDYTRRVKLAYKKTPTLMDKFTAWIRRVF
jgi:hypothetical protein